MFVQFKWTNIYVDQLGGQVTAAGCRGGVQG